MSANNAELRKTRNMDSVTVVGEPEGPWFSGGQSGPWHSEVSEKRENTQNVVTLYGREFI